MLFVVTCLDRPDSLAVRQAARPAHLDYAGANGIVFGGPLLDDAGQPIGSLLVIEAADRAGAEAFAAADPYAQAGLFASTTIHPWRFVFKDGQLI